MGYKFRSVLFGFMYLASSVTADSITVNLFWDSSCQDYATSFTAVNNGANTYGYNYGYSGAHSFGIVNCFTVPPDEGECYAYVNGVSACSEAQSQQEGNCVSYDGSQNTSWDIVSNEFIEGNNGE
ncbi:hypothetical protein V8C35DRAFT_284540 [Trichoderma chlorosporum]